MFNKNSTTFIYDEDGAFGGLLANSLKDNYLEADVKLKIGKKPYFILEKEGLAAKQSLVSFTKEKDNLVIIGKCGQDILDCAEELKLNVIKISGSDEETFFAIKKLGEEAANNNLGEKTFDPPFELGLSHSCFNKNADEKEFALFKESGISHLEIAFGQYADTVNLDFKEYKRLADKYGINLWSFHLPFAPFSTLNPASFDETVRDFTVVYFKELIKEAKRDADIKVFVMHPSGEPIHEDDRKASIKQLKKSVDELCAFAKEQGVTLAIENLPRTCLGRDSAEMMEILNLNRELKMCFDLNHTSNEKAEDIVARFANKIVTLHVSDFFGNDECHLMPGEGSNDWSKIINALIKADYKGPFLYEINRGVLEDGEIWAKEAWHTKLFTRKEFLKHGDVAENFKTLMTNY